MIFPHRSILNWFLFYKELFNILNSRFFLRTDCQDFYPVAGGENDPFLQ